MILRRSHKGPRPRGLHKRRRADSDSPDRQTRESSDNTSSTETNAGGVLNQP